MIRIRALLTLLLLLAAAGPAHAHKLKVFATIEGQDITGYAFFVGGGRAQGTDWEARDGKGETLSSGKTSADGMFRFTPAQPVASDITITVNTQEGHLASTTLKAERFGQSASAPAQAAQTSDTSFAEASTTASPQSEAASTAQIEAAMQRQIEPLLERIEEMDGRLRFTDIMSGIFLIIGLAGLGLWARSKRA